MVGTRAAPTRPRSWRFAQGSTARKSPFRPTLERISPHHGPDRRTTENDHAQVFRYPHVLAAFQIFSVSACQRFLREYYVCRKLEEWWNALLWYRRSYSWLWYSINHLACLAKGCGG